MGSRASRGWVCCGLVLALASTGRVTLAQDNPDAAQLRKMYDDALRSLKAAQDKKNELATDNDRLNGHVAELEKQLQAARRDLAERDRESFYLRAYYASWQRFMERYPTLKLRWDVFLKAPPLQPPFELPEMTDPNWPLSSVGE